MMGVVEGNVATSASLHLYKSASNCGANVPPTSEGCAPTLTRGASEILEQDPGKIIAVINRGHLPSGSLDFQTVLKQMVEERIKATKNSQSVAGKHDRSPKSAPKPNFLRCQSEKTGIVPQRRQVHWAISNGHLSSLSSHHGHHTHSPARAVKRTISHIGHSSGY